MSLPAELSDDQRAAWRAVAGRLAAQGIDIGGAGEGPAGAGAVLAVMGKAGSGKTLLLAELGKAMTAAGVRTVTGDWVPRRKEGQRTLAILAPTNKAASVLRARGVPATTIHRVLYTPVYDPEFERIAEWLGGEGARPAGTEGFPDEALDRVQAFYDETPSIPAALASVGLRGSDFITGWKRRDDPLDVGFVDEASMLDGRQYDDLREIFPTLVLFGDPAQLAPVQGKRGEDGAGGMVFDRLPAARRLQLARVHRQESDSPILDLAHALADPALDFPAFEDMVREAAARDDRVRWAPRVDAGMMARSPVLVWRNQTRVRLISAFRAAHAAPEAQLLPGEPLICDGIELPVKHRKKRIDLEARGLVKGAQCVYLREGGRPGFSRVWVMGAEQPQVSVASIVRIERPDEDEPFIPFAARMGAVFLHGAACTIHKAQGSQWDEVQVFAPDLFVAAKVGRTEAGQPLWKRLAYVAVTRAATRLHWVTRAAMSKPDAPLGTDDLTAPSAPLALEAEAED